MCKEEKADADELEMIQCPCPGCELKFRKGRMTIFMLKEHIKEDHPEVIASSLADIMNYL